MYTLYKVCSFWFYNQMSSQIGSANKFIWVFPYNLTEKHGWTFCQPNEPNKTVGAGGWEKMLFIFLVNVLFYYLPFHFNKFSSNIQFFSHFPNRLKEIDGLSTLHLYLIFLSSLSYQRFIFLAPTFFLIEQLMSCIFPALLRHSWQITILYI